MGYFIFKKEFYIKELEQYVLSHKSIIVTAQTKN
jgi:hypothetical protein